MRRPHPRVHFLRHEAAARADSVKAGAADPRSAPPTRTRPPPGTLHWDLGTPVAGAVGKSRRHVSCAGTGTQSRACWSTLRPSAAPASLRRGLGFSQRPAPRTTDPGASGTGFPVPPAGCGVQCLHPERPLPAVLSAWRPPLRLHSAAAGRAGSRASRDSRGPGTPARGDSGPPTPRSAAARPHPLAASPHPGRTSSRFSRERWPPAYTGGLGWPRMSAAP